MLSFWFALISLSLATDLLFSPVRVTDVTWDTPSSWSGSFVPSACQSATLVNFSYIAVARPQEIVQAVFFGIGAELVLLMNSELILLQTFSFSPNISSISGPPPSVPVWQDSLNWKPGPAIPSEADIVSIPFSNAIIGVDEVVFSQDVRLFRNAELQLFSGAELRFSWPCPRGSIVNFLLPGGIVNVTVSGCSACVSGFYAANFTHCLLCSPGQYWEGPSNFACANCPSGTYQPSSGQFACLTCPIGTFQPEVRSTQCLLCSPGEFRNSSLPANQCFDCPAGTWSSSNGTGNCTQCPKGTFGERLGATSLEACVSCPLIGQTSEVGAKNASQCFCPSLSEPQGRFCVCRPGAGASNIEPLVCSACGFVQYKPDFGNHPCSRCPENSVVIANGGLGATSESQCVCQNDRYRKNGVCVPCAKGGNCSTGTLLTSSGFWRPSPETEVFVKCTPSQACRGGSAPSVTPRHHPTNISSDPQCADGYFGFACSSCVEQQGYAWNGGACVDCTEANIGLIIGLLALSIFFVGYTYVLAAGNAVGKINMMMNYLAFGVQSYLISEFIPWISFAEFGWNDVLSNMPVCMYPFSWQGMWLFQMLVPFILLGLCLVVCLVLSLIYLIFHSYLTRSLRTTMRLNVFNGVKTGILLVFWSISSVTALSITMWSCSNVFGSYVLASYFGFPCSTSTHSGFSALAAVFFFIFCIAIPVAVLILILAADRLPPTLKRFDTQFLTADYTRDNRWWELTFIGRRILLGVIIGVSTTFPEFQNMLLSTLIAICLTLHCWRKPYKTAKSDQEEEREERDAKRNVSIGGNIQLISSSLNELRSRQVKSVELENLLEGGWLFLIAITYALDAYRLQNKLPSGSLDPLQIVVICLNGLWLLLIACLVVYDLVLLGLIKYRSWKEWKEQRANRSTRSPTIDESNISVNPYAQQMVVEL